MFSDGCGAAEGTRTPDLCITNAMLYHLSYCGSQTLLWPYYFYSHALNPLVLQVILAGTR